MTDPSGLTPLMIAGQLARPLPLPVMRAVTRPVFRRWSRSWGEALSGRLSDQSGCLSIRPIGWPVTVDITVGGADGLDIALERPESSAATAIVTASPEVLLDLMAAEDGPDGDGAFFSRALRIEGDTGLVMAFRYAIEDSGLNLRALMSDLPAPVVRLIHILSDRLGPLHARAASDLEKAQTVILAPLRGDLARLAARVTRLESAQTGGRRPRIVSREEVANG